ncbi:hypothetical protein D3C84_1256050 [compost metagenome]
MLLLPEATIAVVSLAALTITSPKIESFTSTVTFPPPIMNVLPWTMTFVSVTSPVAIINRLPLITCPASDAPEALTMTLP